MAAGTPTKEGHKRSAHSTGKTVAHFHSPRQQSTMATLLPATRVPPLDTIDQYAVEKPLGSSAAISSPLELVCGADLRDVASSLIQGYARFVSRFTGLEDVAFFVSRSSSFTIGSQPTRAVASASVVAENGQPSCVVRELGEQHGDRDEIQFYLDLGLSAEPENGERHASGAQQTAKTFTTFIRPATTNGALEIRFAYPGHLIPLPAVEQLLRTLATHLADSAPSLPLKAPPPDLSIVNFPPLMIPPSRETEHNETADSDDPQQFLLHASFEGWAHRKPNAIALDFVHSLPSVTAAAEHSVLTYAALNQAATNLAVHVRTLLSDSGHADYGRIIPVYMTTSPELYISYLAILKAGFAFSPIPQDAPVQRVREILQDIACPIILGNTPEPSSGPWRTDGSDSDGTRHHWVDVAEVSKWRELRDGHLEPSPADEQLEQLHIKHDQTAYLLFTSGSTGKPKGVQVSHLAVACSIASHATAIPLPGDSVGDFRWFQFASPTFDPSLMEIFVTLSSGATLCSALRHLTLTDLEATVNEARATVMMATPSLAALLRPSRLTTLQSLWTMGEKLNRTVIESFSTKSPDQTLSIPEPSRMLVNAYGPTEGAINCTFLAPFGYNVRGSIIGEALPTCAMFVLDPNSHTPKPFPAGLAGELAIGGPQVSKGYLNRPKETAKSFVHSDEFGYLYRTGDMARIVWDESGSQVIEFLGRITSDQVKISGRRLELGEIESALATVQGVTEVVAIVSKRDVNVQGSEQIVACLVASDSSEEGKQRLVQEAQRSTQQHLSSYMCPSSYIFFEALPRSSSGKVDRKAITATLERDDGNLKFYSASKSKPSQTNGVHDDEWETPDDENLQSFQHLVIGIIAESTDEDVSAIKPGTDLFSLGVDSLGAMRLLQRLRDHSLEGLSVGDVLQAGTPKGLVAAVSQHRQVNGTQANGSDEALQYNLIAFSDRNRLVCAERLSVSPEQIQRVLPTTATQSGMLTSFLRSTSDKSFANRSYIYHSVLPLEPHVNINQMKRAWETVIASYDSFRTVFCWLDDDMAPFAQCILADAVSAEWGVYPTTEEASEETLRIALRRAEESIELTNPPWKLSLITSSQSSRIVLSMFHGIFDGGSLQLLLEDVASVYLGKLLASRIPLEHIVKHHFQADHSGTARFWEKHLEGYSPVVFPSVTSYRSRPTKQTGCVEITARTSYDSLKRRSRSMGSTPLSILQAAWGSVLLAYTGTLDQDVVMGSVVSGRLDRDSEACVGPTFTTVPIRLSLSQIEKDHGELWTNRSVARHLTTFNAQTLSHLQPRLGSLVTAEGRLPYDTLIAYQDFNAGSSDSGLWSSIDHPAMANDFAVMIEVWPGVDSSLTFRASFNDAQLDHTSAEMMLRQMSDIVSFILNQPDGNFLNASSCTAPDLRSSFNPDPSFGSNEALLHSQFEEHAASHPDDPALIFKHDLDDDSNPHNIIWSYSELNALANYLADSLLQTGAQLTNSPIPICIEKSPAMYVAILGILKAGGAWCPIDTLSPPQRRHDLIARTASKILLVSGADGPLPEGSIPTGVDVIDVSKFTTREVTANGVAQRSQHRATPDGMAYLIWTSGTTGAPKGVPIKHSSAVSSMKSLQKDIPTDVAGGVRCLQFSQYTFDVSIQDIFYTWGVGGVLISASREIMLGSFSRLANITKATHAHLTPAFAAGVSRKSCETLQVITMIGEKLTQPVADDWGTNMRAFNTYGPAEVTVVSTIREFGNEHKNIKSANIGWPMDTVSVFVTKDQRLVMKNAIGELALGGPQLSPGYLNQEDVNKIKYVWNEEAGQVVYYTGDLVRMLADGSLEYINRADDLVKLGGIRVELSEISFSLAQCHPLAESIETMILNRPDRPNKVVVAFISASKAANTDDEQILVLGATALEIARAASNKAQSVLPDHMIPSVYLVVSRIPRTSSAKTDRRALQAAYACVDIDSWERELNPEADGFVDPEDQANASMANQIMDMIASLAKISKSIVTKSSRMGSLGIDSIRAIRLASRLKEAGHQLSVVEVLNCVTIQDLVRLVSASGATEKSTFETFDVGTFNETWHPAAATRVLEEFVTVRATTIQESLLSETMGTYNMYWSNHFFALDTSVDVTRLKQAWLATSQKVEALRTGFIPVAEVDNKNVQSRDFSILQIIYTLPDLDWEYVNCSAQELVELRDNRIEDIMTRHQKNYFRHSPWAVTVFDTGDARLMVLTIHHSIHDGPSLGLIMNDVRSAYAYKPPRRHQLTDALSIILPGEKRSVATRNFWEAELKRFSELDAPVWPDLTGKRLQPGEAPRHEFIAEELLVTHPTAKLQSFAAQLGVSSIASVVRAAWAYVSLGYLGIPATVFAETLSDRVLHADLEDCIGPLISVVPIPFHPTGSTRELLAEQHRLSVQAWQHRHIHAREVRKMLKRPRGEALYPAVFNFHVARESDSIVQPGVWRELEDEVGLHVEHPMALNVFQGADGSIVLEASADSSMMCREQLSIFVRQIDGLISSMLESPDEPLASLVTRLPATLRSVSYQPVSEEVANSVHLSPTYWLEVYAAKRPELTAVEVASSISSSGVEKETMTYGTLNAAANRVAAFIASHGHKNTMIAVCSGRNLPSYPIIIGIFKSGNTYLPIEEGLPMDRKTFLVEDAECPIVFTETSLSAAFANVPKSCRVLCIDDPELANSFATMPSDDRDYQSDPDDLAYLLFTSGSTGKPKGVMVTRGNLSSFIESFSEFTCRQAPVTLELAGTGKYLAQASRAFDPHLLEMFFPWRHGMATATAPRTMILDDLGLTLSKWDITHASLVPSLVDQTSIVPEQCPTLKYMTVGGEKISQKVLDTWATAPQMALVNAYGPTEVTIGCTFARVGKDTNLRNIGPPLAACVGHVLVPGTFDYALRGQTGELCFSGDLVAKGYLNRPDATGFVTGPGGERMYRTGDIGRLMPDDSVEYLGRGDDQTKIRGQRLELGEVSEVVRSSSPVRIDVVTTVAKHPGLSRMQLICFIARSDTRQREKGGDVVFLQSDFGTLGKELQDVCKKQLPSYMVPELILPITYIPLAPMSGKANVKELQGLFSNLPLPTVLQGNRLANKDGTVVTRSLTADEEAVVKEICAIISVDSATVGPLTNIFEIGLDSLSAIGLSIKLRNIGYEATVAIVMGNPVVEQLARLPRSSSSLETDVSKTREAFQRIEMLYRLNPSPGVDVSEVTVVRPCLPLQEGLVARSINGEGKQLYVNHVILRLESRMDVDKLKSAWQAVVRDTEILRTSFAPLDKQVVQVVFSADSHRAQWKEEEYASLDDSIEQNKAQRGLVSQDIISNISKDPPVRFLLARNSETKESLALFINIHHALYDGESFSMLMEDVAAHYAAQPTPQRGSPSAFIEHALTQGLEKAKRHWSRFLEGCYPTLFRADTNIMELPTSIHRKFSSKLSELEHRSASLQTTVPSLVQAIFALLLADTVGVADVTYGLVLSGRAVSVPGASSVLLPCITTIPGRLNTANLGTVAEVVEDVQKSTVRSLDFQHTSLRHIQRWVRADTPLFDCLFSYIRTASPPQHGLWQELDSHMPAEYPLAVEVEANHSADTIQLNCVFSSAFGSVYNADEFLEKMDAVLSSVVSGESLSLDNFNISGSSAPGSRPAAVQWDDTAWSTTETAIQEITIAFCGLTSVEVTKGASFLSLGVDSVTAIQFARKLREAGLGVSSADVMRFSCVGALAKHVEEDSTRGLDNEVNGDGDVTAIPVEQYGKHVRLLGETDSVTAMFETTPLQSGMITQTLGSGQVYVHPHPVRLRDSVDSTRLKAALRKVIETNDILRTSFHLIEELGPSWIGAVHSSPPFEWKEVNLSSGVDVLSEVNALYSFSEESSFETPPIRSILVTQPEARLLVIVLHHALYDGASIPFLFEDLAVIYDGGSPERPQFSDTVKHVVSGQNEACDFWTRNLLGYEVSEVPELPVSESSDRMFLSERRVDLDLSSVIEACKAMEVTVQSVALLAYSKVIAGVMGKRDVVFGQVLAGRSLPVAGAERTLGPLFNTVAQRVTFEPKFLSNRAMAQRLQQLTIDSQTYQHAPLRIVQNALRQANMTTSVFFDTLFVFQKSADFAGSIIEEQQIWMPYETDEYAAEAEYKLNIEVDHARDGIVARANCNGRYISQEKLNCLLDEFVSAFRDVIEHPARCVTIVPDGLGELPVKLPREQSPASEADSEAPSHESIVLSVLAEIAGVSVDNITPTTSIFNIGLDSLSAIRIAAICRSKGLKTSVADILQGNTVRGISQRIQPMPEQTVEPQGALIKNYDEVEKTALQRLNLSKDSVEAILPCLGGQLYHLIGWLKSGRKLFEPAWPYFSSERIDSTRLEEAWYQLRQRHPILRTCFAAISPSEAVQVVLKHATRDPSIFKVIKSSASITKAAQAQAREEALHPSTLFTPPVRLRLLKATDRDGILILINHAAYDAWTMPMFATELAQLYRGQTPSTNPDFPSFVDFSLRSLRPLDEEQYWSSALQPASPTLIRKSPTPSSSKSLSSAWKKVKSLLRHRPRREDPNKQLFVSAWEQVKNLAELERKCRSAGLSLQTIVLLAVARCIARLTGVSSPTIGLYQTGRSASFNDIENLSGPCLNVNPFTIPDIFPTSSSGSGNDNLLTQALTIQSALAARVPYEQSSLRDVLVWAQSSRTKAPLFNTWINLLWMQNGIPSATDPSPSSTTETNNNNNKNKENENLFHPLRIGVPTDFLPTKPLRDTRTAVSDLDTSFLSSENVFIDVGPDASTDSIGFGVRVEGGVLGEREVRALVGEMGREVERLVHDLDRCL
ncbi:nonribosomal siderophore peptide synthase SidC [Aspergillus heteromorphus CBS 117.55]|uniref:Nonribosomal peptide synthetase sidC n=1 Tax=Aspergillus heteromorphus CBS 117.55 TaxID=1448321 RepID=A0A317X067_9EURO|nr:nonribosomal siderophore peptide synthase SidC [Aspergillus heteromorphus CBS 117.55]PWY89880.1 nonribosomal siderophore peptide synthase SidC [Aspergillus heteromorphus CBS 117.55]